MRYRLDDVCAIGASGGELDALGVRGGRLAPPERAASLCLEGRIVLPAFVNAHDHLELDGLPRTGRAGAYRNAREWYEDVAAARERPALADWLARPLAVRVSFGGFLNLFNGCLTVAHHNPYHRNFRRRFPVEVIRRYGWVHSLALEPDPRRAFRRAPAGAPFVLHFAEGRDGEAEGELDRLAALGLLTHRTVLVHAVGLRPDDFPRIAAAGAGIVWCPSSNAFLFDRSLAFAAAREAGVAIALGSDSTLSGEGGLLRELGHARAASGLSGWELLRLATLAPARMFGLSDRGDLGWGLRADLLILDRSVRREGFCPSGLTPAAIEMVIREGRPVLGSPELEPVFHLLKTPVVLIRVGNLERLLARRYRGRWDRLGGTALERLAALLASPQPSARTSAEPPAVQGEDVDGVDFRDRGD